MQSAACPKQTCLECAGPDTFTRCLAGRQLAFLIRQLDYKHLSTILPLVLPYVHAIVKDPSPSVQRYGLHALQHVATGTAMWHTTKCRFTVSAFNFCLPA